MKKEEAGEKSTERRRWDDVIALVAAERCKQRGGSWDEQKLQVSATATEEEKTSIEKKEMQLPWHLISFSS